MSSCYSRADLVLQQLRGDRALLRINSSVPLADNQEVDSACFEDALPAIRELRSAGVRMVTVSPRGRPEVHPGTRHRLRPVGERLGETIDFAEDCGGEPVGGAVGLLGTGGSASLEQLAGKVLPGVAVLEKTP